jgi:hypothetical protein
LRRAWREDNDDPIHRKKAAVKNNYIFMYTQDESCNQYQGSFLYGIKYPCTHTWVRHKRFDSARAKKEKTVRAVVTVKQKIQISGF